MIDGARILITGGTGSFGKAFVSRLMTQYSPKRVILFSRDEYKMNLLQNEYKQYGDKIDYFIGDVRDVDRLRRAFNGVDIVVHAAAMKQIPMCEAHPFEAVNTNVIGAENVCNAALDAGVKKIVFLSTDKAVSPTNLYGTTKLAAEKITIGANIYAGGKSSFSVVRYGNVAGSRGSVIPFFRECLKRGESTLLVTDHRMTRFWLTISEAVDVVIYSIEHGEPGEITIPKMPSFRIRDLASALVTPGPYWGMQDATPLSWRETGIRPGEKLHECMLGEYDYFNTYESDAYYHTGKAEALPRVAEGFRYSTDANPWFLTVDEIRERLEAV